MIAPQTLSRVAVALLACVMLPGIAHAEGLQVAPVSVTIPERSGLVWLNNESERPLQAQIRVYRWHQDAGEDELVETSDLVASPPFVAVEPGQQQVIRLVRFGDAAVNQTVCEQTYRIIVDELPSVDAAPEDGLQYVLRYSVPVYLTDPECGDSEPLLSWQIARDGDQAWLNVVNLGQTRAQLANVSFIKADGTALEISGGLLGYVLPGAERHFALANPASEFGNGGQIEVSINGSQVREPVSLVEESQ